MKILLILCILSFMALAQEIDDEVVVLNSNPYGKFDGIQVDSNAIYVVINDTSQASISYLKVFVSQDSGKTFNLIRSSSSSNKPVNQIKLLKKNDTLYVLFSVDSIITIFNVNTGIERFESFSGLTGWDAIFSSKGNLHLFYSTKDSLIHRYKTSESSGWLRQSGTPNLSMPRLETNRTQDTIYLSAYLTPSASIPSKQNIILSLLTTTTSDTLLPLTYTLLTTDTSTIRTEYAVIPLRNYVHLIHTVRNGDSMNLYHAYSSDRGFNINESMPFAASTKYQEYWFDYDIDHEGNRVNIIFYADSLQLGASTSETDAIMFSSIVNDTMINEPTQISNNIPYWHPNEFKPKIFSIYNEEEQQAGVLYAGIDSTGAAKVFFKIIDYNVVISMDDKYKAIKDFKLYSNYPNPFNPSTEIKFYLPEKSLISLIVYDMLGNKVTTLINNELNSGEHKVEFNAENLSSGMYIYKLEAGKYNATGKMMLLK